MLVLFETPASFALFKVLDEEKFSKVEVILRKKSEGWEVGIEVFDGGVSGGVDGDEALDEDEDDDVTPNYVFLHVQTKDLDRAELVRRREEHIQATPDQPIDEDQLYYDTTGDWLKGRIYGLGSYAGRNIRYIVRGFHVDSVENAYGLRREHLLSTTAVAAATSTTSRASSQVVMGSTHSPEQQHDDDDRDI
ncbi:hypothetical protein Syun_014258 [Stephania yunnanensis]|uniref:Uncharacterized protein n=1 Tax=Stephania yunnanensis TaxID=152371 RepID=A0AAP0JKN7_9MAGN